MYCYFKPKTGIISQQKTWTWLQKGSLKRTKSLLIAVQNNAIRTNCIEAKIDCTQNNSKKKKKVL